MTHKEVIAMIQEMGIDFAYDHFEEGHASEPPFICFLYPKAQNFGADDIVYVSSRVLHIELYTDRKDPAQEAAVEAILTAHELYWDREETWIPSEKLYEVLYSMVV